VSLCFPSGKLVRVEMPHLSFPLPAWMRAGAMQRRAARENRNRELKLEIGGSGNFFVKKLG
jgi:hypothetical protein